MPLEYQGIVKQLSVLNYNIIVYCYGNHFKVDQIDGYTTIKQFKRSIFNLIFLPALFKEDLKLKDFHCFFLVSGHLPQNIAVSNNLIQNKINYVFCPGGSYSPFLLKRKYFLSKIYRFCFELKILKNAYVVRSYSKTNELNIRNYGYKGDFFELLEGINEKDLPSEVNRISSNNNRINIIYLGRIDYYGKGIDQLLLAFEKVKKFNLKFKLNIYGPFASKKDKKLFVGHLRNFDTDTVEYCGAVYGEKKFVILKSSDLFVYPSRFEGIPRSIRESLYLGTPILVTKETNFAEYINKYNCGFVCKCLADDIYNSLLEFANHPEKEKLRTNSKYLMTEFYNWDKIRIKLNILLNRFVENHSYK